MRRNPTVYSFEEPINNKNSYESNIIDDGHISKFSHHDAYCPNPHFYCRSYEYANANVAMQDPASESKLNNADTFDCSKDDTNQSHLLPQAQICPVYTGVVYKGPDSVYTVPLKKRYLDWYKKKTPSPKVIILSRRLQSLFSLLLMNNYPPEFIKKYIYKEP
ncbi:unnamed protein product [Trichobilharzia regenti]|nr:unnamed protein product [Trichobilharzia regenti]